MSKWIEIDNLDDFLKKIRKKSFQLFTEINSNMNDEVSKKIHENDLKINDVLNEKEVFSIVVPQLKKDKNNYKFTKKTLNKIIENLNSRMISNSVKELASRGIFEIAFDDKINDFVFWTKK